MYFKDIWFSRIYYTGIQARITHAELRRVAVWLNSIVVSALGIQARGPGFHPTIPLDSNLGQVVNSHCLRSFSAPRNCGTNREFSAPKWSWWLSALD